MVSKAKKRTPRARTHGEVDPEVKFRVVQSEPPRSWRISLLRARRHAEFRSLGEDFGQHGRQSAKNNAPSVSIPASKTAVGGLALALLAE